MKIVNVKPNQNIFDVALERYGNIYAVPELIALNPRLRNDPESLGKSGAEKYLDNDFFIDAALMPGDTIVYDENSPLRLKAVLRQIQSPITTYEYKNYE